MLVLIACEFSGVVRDAFRSHGHEAWSCDLLPCVGDPTYHLQGDVDVLLHTRVWDLMIAHPPCFSGDSLVLTESGYKEIASILIGERVLTHLGRWRRVTDIQKQFANKTTTISITGSGPIVTTEEHPFLVKSRTWEWENSSRRYRKRISSSSWCAAENLTKKHLIGSVLPPIDGSIDVEEEHLWLMGLYAADGHLRWRKNKFESVHFSIGSDKAEEFKAKVKRKTHEEKIKSVSKFTMYGNDFCSTFSQFGRSCESKSLPGWVLQLAPEKAKIFLSGYLFGDGHFVKNTKLSTSSSVSKKLSTSIALLMRRVYKKPACLNKIIRKNTTVIEGRTVSQLPSWVVQCNVDSTKVKSIIDDDYTWYAFRKQVKTEGYLVYNLSVDEDESYMVNQAIVHNCTYLTNAGVRHLHEHVVTRTGKRTAVYGEARREAMRAAAKFFKKLLDAPIPHIAIENPIMHKYAVEIIGRRQDQVIQPWMFGHPEQKATCLWLKNLPLLQPTNNVRDKMLRLPKSQQQRLHYLPPSKDRWALRSVTFKGIAEAMATQWSNL